MGMSVVHVHLVFSFAHNDQWYPCALVEWFVKCGRRPDDATGMWIVECDEHRNGQRVFSVIHLDTVFCAAHLIPEFGPHLLPLNFDHRHSLDYFDSFYINSMQTITLMNVFNREICVMTSVEWLSVCKATSKMRAYQATQRLRRSYNTKTKEYSD